MFKVKTSTIYTLYKIIFINYNVFLSKILYKLSYIKYLILKD